MRAVAALIVTAFALSGTGCAPNAPNALKSVPEVVANIHALNGKTVSVTGYLGECAGYECRLFVDEAGWHIFERAVKELIRTRKYVPWPPHLGIGDGDNFDFDRKAERFTYSYVVITGRVTDMCRDWAGEPRCSDRSTDLEPAAIRAWVPPLAAPANKP